MTLLHTCHEFCNHSVIFVFADINDQLVFMFTADDADRTGHSVCVHCPQRVGLLSCWLFQIGLYIALFSPSCYPWHDTGVRCVSVVDCFSSNNRYCSGWQHNGEHIEYGCKQVRIFQCIDINY
jgi:hypothetical protein